MRLSHIRRRYETLKDILLWARERFGFEARPRQDELLRAIHIGNKIAYRIGRQFGKTELLAIIALYMSWCKLFPIERGGRVAGFRGPRGLMASAKDDWADTLYERTRSFMDRDDEMRGMIQEGAAARAEREAGAHLIRIRLSPYKRIIFPHGGFIDFRGPGDKGEGPRSKTYDWKIIDEADYMPKAFWVAEGPTSINTPAALTILSSTPTGRREYFYRACTDPKMGFKEFHISGEENPNFTEEKKKELMEELGEEGYDREIRANWGVIMSGAFPDVLIDAAIFQGAYLRLKVSGKTHADPAAFVRAEVSAWAAENGNPLLLLGGDLGSKATSPSELLLGQPEGDAMDIVGIITLSEISWPLIEDVIRALDDVLRLDSIVLDATGVGAPVCQNLQARDVPRAPVYPFDFGSSLTVAEGLRKNAKVWSTDAIVSMLQHEDLGIPSDDEFLYQFRNHTVDLSRGRPIYSKIDDHMVDGLRCLVYGFFRDRFSADIPARDADKSLPVAKHVQLAATKNKDAPPTPGKLKFRSLNTL